MTAPGTVAQSLFALDLRAPPRHDKTIGTAKRQKLIDEFGIDGLGVIQSIKEALDPNGIMNPDKIFLSLSPKVYAQGKKHAV